MGESPFSAILDIIRTEVSRNRREEWRLARVRSLSPLSIECGGNVIDGANLRVNPQILDETVSESCRLKTGDTVALLCNEELDSFAVICKLA